MAKKKSHNRLDLVGKTFGRLLVTRDAGTDANGQSIWRCRCECGKTTVATGDHLRRGMTKSCGCGQGRHPNDDRVAIVRLCRQAGMTWTAIARGVGISRPAMAEFRKYHAID